MAFDQATRNRLARFVGDARALLTEEFTRQLQLEYAIDPASGAVAGDEQLAYLDDARRQTAHLLRATLEHYLAGVAKPDTKARQAAIERIVREQAFTVLNRLCALRMAEARGLLIESVARGYQSKGFQLYARVAGPALGETGDAYRSYLFSLFDEFAVDLAVLFDRFSPQGRLCPREATLLTLLEQINHPEIEALWAEDETIGWIYQYFNSREERKAMRDASAAPRNSRELAVRNQFFTPRYVVEFLTDNTLGRIWHEMTQGQTGLVDSCRYLVRRPNEIFLAPGEKAPPQADAAENLSQEELLKQSVHIPHRPLKDPRTITMLDPACGSMHFGLYAFDLFERIYDEAWELEGERGSRALERAPLDAPLHKQYPDKESFLREVPRLIVERNIHGVDIDPRAVQIAGLSLWLRAQRSWRDQGIRPQERPDIKRSNIVCAEPMPGDKGLLAEFIAKQLAVTPEDRAIGEMLPAIFTAMELAGEAGSLLKIEEQIAGVVEAARAKFEKAVLQRRKEINFLPGLAPERNTTLLDLLDLPNPEEFWQQAEGRIYAALREYAAQAENGAAYRRRLFADDAERGFAFIDLCRKRYDVVLMNPPFGAASSGWKATFEKAYPCTKNDLYAAFVERGIDMQYQGGMLGAITSRSGFFLTSFQKWREEVLLHEAPPTVFADLGYGVLDSAMVETAAYCLQRGQRGATTFFRLVSVDDKAAALDAALSDPASCIVFRAETTSFAQISGTPFAYWVSRHVRGIFENLSSYESEGRLVLGGLKTLNDERFIRSRWEVPTSGLAKKAWVSLSKGGAYSQYYADLPVVVDWLYEGQDISWYGYQRRPREGFGAASRGIEAYYRPGLTWNRRTQGGFNVRVHPSDSIFSDRGPTAFIPKDDRLYLYRMLGLMNSQFFNYLVGLQIAFGSYEVGVIQRTPIPPKNDTPEGKHLGELARACVELKRTLDTTTDISSIFCAPVLLQICGATLVERAALWAAKIIETNTILAIHQHDIDAIAYALYGIDGENRSSIEESLNGSIYDDEERIVDSTEDGEIKVETSADIPSLVAALLSYFVGSTLGRWDIRYATGEHAAPELPDPFAPLPVCSPGMLQNAAGLPAAPADIPASYPLRISWPGILVDDEGHPEDVEGRAREALRVIWGERAEAIEQEACEILSVRSLREYFRKPALFFADHLSRYSKSRRQAPIYWPLSTNLGSYTLWLYYHRLTDQTLYSCVNDFVDPKLAQVSQEAAGLRRKAGRSAKEEKDLERLADLEQELQAFRAELLRVATFWKPNLNDGVQITAAPLWLLFAHKPWQKKLKETWVSLETGEYDWAHLAYSIWPERVRAKCRADKSLAIAHDLEALYVAPLASAAKKGRAKKVAEVENAEMFGD